MQSKLTTHQNSEQALFLQTIYRKSPATLASFIYIPTRRILAEIWRNTMQLGKYRTVDTYASSAGARSTHCADADVATLARNGLSMNFMCRKEHRLIHLLWIINKP